MIIISLREDFFVLSLGSILNHLEQFVNHSQINYTDQESLGLIIIITEQETKFFIFSLKHKSFAAREWQDFFSSQENHKNKSCMEIKNARELALSLCLKKSCKDVVVAPDPTHSLISCLEGEKK